MNAVALAMMLGAVYIGLESNRQSLVEPARSSEVRAIDGERIHLDSLPGFTSRLFVPIVPGSVNAFSIGNERIRRVVDAPKGFSLSVESGGLLVGAERSDSWGYATVETDRRSLTLTLFGVIPATRVRDGLLDGYHIGKYRSEPLRGLESYAPPRGFIRMTEENGDARVSDSYTLRDFQCKLDGGGSKFLVLRPEALIKLELMQRKLAARTRVAFDRFTIMSRFRTPYYNSQIGNETSYSRHLYGDAMDIFVDGDGNRRMDDVNGDGRVNERDAAMLLAVAEELDESTEWGWLKGGAGAYRANKAHGPFLHVDTRGYVARWGAVR